MGMATFNVKLMTVDNNITSPVR